MKKPILLLLLTALMLLGGGFLTPAHAQSPATDLKPTFISPTPGLYVNGWPAFTVTYPKEWVEMPPPPALFRAGAPRPDSYPSPSFIVLVWTSPRPLEEWAKEFMPIWVEYMTDIKVLSDKPSQLKDGTPAREVETEFVPKVDAMGRSVKDGSKRNGFLLVTKKDVTWVGILLSADAGKLDEDVKKVAHSLTFLPGREEPVQVPPDVKAFLDMYRNDIVSHDVKTIMTHFSDRFLWGGMSKAFFEQGLRSAPTSPIQMGVISFEPSVTVFEPRGDKACIDGFWLQKAKGETTAVKIPMFFQQIISEHGQWKWFGNQK